MSAYLHPAVHISDWWRGDLGTGGKVISSPSGLARRAVVSVADIVVDNEDVVGISMALAENYSALIAVDGAPLTVTSPVGRYAVFAPGQVASMQFVGRGRFLNLGLSVRTLKKCLFDDFDIYGDRFEFITRLGQFNRMMEKAMLRVATADSENAYQAVVSCVALLLRYHTSLSIDVQETRSRSMTPVRMRRVLDKIEADLANSLTLHDLATTAGISTFHFAREFQLATGYSPYQYIVRRRIDRAIQSLAETKLPTEVIARAVGFHRASHMSRHMQRVLGLTPRELRGLL